MNQVTVKKTVEVINGNLRTRYNLLLPEYTQPIIIAKEAYIDEIIEQLTLLRKTITPK